VYDKLDNEIDTEPGVVFEISDGRRIPACRARRRDWSTKPGLQGRQKQSADAVQSKPRTCIIIIIIITNVTASSFKGCG